MFIYYGCKDSPVLVRGKAIMLRFHTQDNLQDEGLCSFSVTCICVLYTSGKSEESLVRKYLTAIMLVTTGNKLFC